MIEPRFYNALTAGSFCEAGRFVVCGRKLRPFSLLHSAQLEALDSPIWANSNEPEPGDLSIAAQICASEKPVIEFKQLARETEDDWRAWFNYLEVCAARPMMKEAVKTAVGSCLNAPTEMLIATYLLRMTALTEERIWSMPYGLVMWYMESTREQETGESMILTQEESDELDRMNTPEEKENRKVREENARFIIEHTSDAAARYDLLRKCQADELPEGWQEGLTPHE